MCEEGGGKVLLGTCDVCHTTRDLTRPTHTHTHTDTHARAYSQTDMKSQQLTGPVDACQGMCSIAWGNTSHVLLCTCVRVCVCAPV